MRAVEFRIWQATVRLNGRKTALALGKSEDTISLYRTQGVAARESRIVRMACAAILANLEPWKAPG